MRYQAKRARSSKCRQRPRSFGAPARASERSNPCPFGGRDASLRLDVGRLHDRPPFLEFGLVKRGKTLGCLLLARRDDMTKVGETLAHGRIGQRIDQRGVKCCTELFPG